MFPVPAAVTGGTAAPAATRAAAAVFPAAALPIAPSVPSAVTSITRDAGATVSFLSPAAQGAGPVTAYVVTPYIGGAAQAPATLPVASLGSLTGSNGNVYRQASVAGLANGTAYTFTVKARNAFAEFAGVGHVGGEHAPGRAGVR